MRVDAHLEVLAPPEKVFEILADMTARARFMAELESWEHISGPRVGEGGQFRLRQRIGPVALTSLVQIVDWKPPTTFSWSSLKGLRTWGRFTVRPSTRGSMVRLRLGFASGENVLSFVVDRVAAPLVRRQAQASLHALAQEVVSHLSRRARGAAAEAAGVTTVESTEPVRTPRTLPTGKARERRPKGLPRTSKPPVRRSRSKPATG